MTLETAIILLAVAAAGVVLAFRCLRKKTALRVVCLVLLILIALLLAGYIGLSLLFVDAARHH